MKNTPPTEAECFNHRVLVIDDNPAIHQDFRKILSPVDSTLQGELDADEASLFGETSAVNRDLTFQIDSAFQGQEGLEMVRAAVLAGTPYAVAFVDVRMPPGWDGIETISYIWKEFPDLQIVICTAYSDYSWEDIAKAVGNTDHVLILKKPFDNIEVMQMAHALSKKWQLTQIANRQLADLDALVAQRTEELHKVNLWLKGEIAQRTAAQDLLTSSEERFSKAFHSSPVPMAIQRANRPGFLDANDRFLTLLDAEREPVLAGEVSFWVQPGTSQQINLELAAHHAVRDFASTIRTVSGDTREVLVAADNLELGSEPYYLLIVQDITDRVRLENELRQAQKMEAVGRLAAGVAHDFNNMLTVILGYSSMMQNGSPRLDGKLASYLRQVEQAAERATALTRQLLAYSRKQIIQRRPLQLNEIVNQTVGMLRRVIGEHIALDMQLAMDLPFAYADTTSVDQVIMNLALNSRDAMPDGGKLTLSTTMVEIDDAYCARTPDAQPGRFICLTVQDSGHGMDSATLNRIFEPFFTTKEPGKGTGMGLATVYGVLKQHEGWVEVDSALRRGTTFRAYLPVAEGAVMESPTPAASAAPQSAPEGDITILLVEDEEMLRDFVSTALTSLGYRVLSACNGREALEVWAESRTEVDLLLTDVVMPESISGRDLAHKLIMDKPDLKVIFTSGYSAELIGPEFEQEKEHGFLSKPYLTDKLAKVVAAQLAKAA